MSFTLSQQSIDKFQRLISQGILSPTHRLSGAQVEVHYAARQVEFIYLDNIDGSAFVSLYNASSDTWTDCTGDCVLVEVDGETLEAGKRYPAIKYGVADGLHVWITRIGAGGSPSFPPDEIDIDTDEVVFSGGTSLTINNPLTVINSTTVAFDSTLTFAHSTVNLTSTSIVDLSLSSVRSFIRFTTNQTANISIYSLALIANGYFVFFNATDYQLHLIHDDGATGTATLRFHLPNNQNVIIPPKGMGFFYRDDTSNRYRAGVAAQYLQAGTGSGNYAAGNDARLSDARTPTAHKTSHQSGGSDAIALDTLAATTDITTLNSSSSAHGLLPKLSNTATQYLSGVGTWTVPTGTPPTIASKSGNFTADTTPYVYLCDVSSGSITCTLPASSGNNGLYHIFKLVNNASGNTNTLTIDANSTETIDLALTQVLQIKQDDMIIACDNSNWVIESDGRQEHSARATYSTTQSVNSGTPTALLLDTETWDSCAIHSTSSNTSRMTVARAGTYAITGQGAFAAHATGQRNIDIRKNGSTIYGTMTIPVNSGTLPTGLQVSCHVNLAATEYVEVFATHTAGVAVNVSGAALQITRVGPAY